MDADFKEKRRLGKSAIIEKRRWSMNSQRLEEIVAELMRPIGDLRHSFDTDLSALLEEYLTEAGLHALAAEEEDSSPSTPAPAPPNFAELALLLQQSASIYGRKVDFLYQHVLSVSDSLHSSTMEIANTTNEEEPATPSGSRRKRRASGAAAGPSDFCHIELQPGGGAVRREAGAARPPPTLPRCYMELEPRALAEGEEPLLDYAGEPIGVLADFHVSWRLHNGLLVEELDGWEGRQALRPIPLMELQAAIEANAPPSPPPLKRERDDTPPPPDPDPPACSTPLPLPPPASTEMPPPPPPPPPSHKKERKRKSNEELNERSFKLLINKEFRVAMSRSVEFEVTAKWVSRVVGERTRALLELRRSVANDRWAHAHSQGFEHDKLNISGFAGWSGAEGEAAVEAVRAAGAGLGTHVRLHDDSDDDGFFEQSSLGDSDASRNDEPTLLHTQIANATAPAEVEAEAMAEKSEAELAEEAEWAAWRARVAARASAGEARPPLDVAAVAAQVLEHIPDEGTKPLSDLLTEAVQEETDVSRLFLATLFLANAGNVEIQQGPPLTLNSCSLKLLSRDPRLYSAAAANDPISAPHTATTPHTTTAPASASATGPQPARTNKK